MFKAIPNPAANSVADATEKITRFLPKSEHLGQMHKHGWILVAFLHLALCLYAAPSTITNTFPQVKLSTVPVITIAEPQTTPQETARIKQLISNLALVERPDWGASSTLAGTAFSPVAGSEKLVGAIRVPANLETSSNLVELVRLGPTALPFLLAALDDSTPTRIIIRLPMPGMGAMWFASELQGNPAVALERKVIAARSRIDSDRLFAESERLRTYNMTVGDLCFVAIGQIVNRSYAATRYQMTACTVINSPTHDSVLAKEVREIWDTSNPSRHLLASLLTDYATIAIKHTADSRAFHMCWRDTEDLQSGAAMRLLYYFPQETTNLIAGRLRAMDIATLDRVPDYNVERKLVEAVAWCTEPVIEAELRRMFQATTNPYILTLTANAMRRADAPACRQRLEDFLDRLPPNAKGPYKPGKDLLLALGKGFGSEAKPCFTRYVTETNLPSRQCLCDVLSAVHGEWSVDLLGSWLTDTNTDKRYEHALIAGKRNPSLPVRICDEAANIISRNFPKLKFEMIGTEEQLDRQIQIMRDQIAQHDY